MHPLSAVITRKHNKTLTMSCSLFPGCSRSRIGTQGTLKQHNMATASTSNPHASQSELPRTISLLHRTITLLPIKNNPYREYQGSRRISLHKKITLIDSILPHPVPTKQSLTKQMSGKYSAAYRVLNADNFEHITAKKWVLYDSINKQVIKGYKYKKQHDVASLSKLMTFYTAYKIIQDNYIIIDKFDMLTQLEDYSIKGTKILLKVDYLLSLEDALYALLLASANNAATILANNLGGLLLCKRKGQYFSCFDLTEKNRIRNTDIFVCEMNNYAKEMDLYHTLFENPHGMCKNLSSAVDIAQLTGECMKIPLFCKIVGTASHAIQTKYVDDTGEYLYETLLIENTNRLLKSTVYGYSECIGGKTGCNMMGGESFVGCFYPGVIAVVLGSLGREYKFADCLRLLVWLKNQTDRR